MDDGNSKFLIKFDVENLIKNLQVKFRASTSSRTTTKKGLLSAFGIPELMPPIRRQTFKVNLHAPTSSRTTTNKSLLGALGIPDLNRLRRWTFKVNPHIILADTTINERGFPLSLRRMRRKREWKMSLRDPVFTQFSTEALNFQNK